jgi:hypothetical protein
MCKLLRMLYLGDSPNVTTIPYMYEP